ncbi:MAG: Fic family protein [Candidatus Koribacter versatilis]|uniref:Fic family protein n=1 Tax=Candidatus Korobacter versatilis TaxID=658062 RepID=A0A932A8K3_9BACT|nr:Fic family protein [Candidatus Koribacter versatilis]
MPDYKWKPIEPLSDEERKIDLATMPLYETWRASKKRLEESSPAQLADFNKRLIRRLSVETGILERLYDLDRGTTEALVAYGFAEDLVSHSSTNIEPSRLIDILHDQEAAVQLVIDCVAKNRELTKGIIHELHAILTRHQDMTMAADQFGNRREIPLLKGKFKEQPNNPKRQDGTLHEYCPPVQVESEIDNLLAWLPGYGNDDPITVAAWFHHRFTQIHPYQDGNGRVARALTTLILLRADLLPLVVDRDLRTEYIKALEMADHFQLSVLAEIFSRLERKAILQALSVDADSDMSHQMSLTSAVIESLADKFGKRRVRKLAELRQVNSIAQELRTRARTVLEQYVTELRGTLEEVGEPDVHIVNGGPDRGNAHWYRFEVVQSAKEAGKFANFDEDHYFIKSSIRVGRERMIFVVSFHHVGREITGIMEATAFSRLESYEDSEDRESVSERFSLCSVEPFVFTYKTKTSEIADAFGRWLDAALAVAVKEYGDQL